MSAIKYKQSILTGGALRAPPPPLPLPIIDYKKINLLLRKAMLPCFHSVGYWILIILKNFYSY